MAGKARDERVLVLAPTGRDAVLACGVLARAGIVAEACERAATFRDGLRAGAGAAIVAQEAFEGGYLDELLSALEDQPAWSDLPVLVLMAHGAASASHPGLEAALHRRNVTMLERPVRVATLVSAVQAALRARARQYDLRDQLAERDRQDEALRRSQAELSDFFENASEGLDWISPEGIVLWANKSMLEMLDRGREGYVGHEVDTFHAHRAEVHHMLSALARGETLRDHEAVLKRPDGRLVNVLINADPVFDEGRLLHSRRFVRDVTERARAEAYLRRAHAALGAKAQELESANHELSQYAYIVSHDLKAPLRAIQHYADFLRLDLGTVQGEAAADLDNLQRSVRHAEGLVDGLLELCRVGTRSVSAARVDICHLIEDVIGSLNLPAEVEIETRCEVSEVQVDAPLLRQVLQNLLLNAAKFNASSRKAIRVECLAAGDDPAAAAQWELRVSDNGIGIEQRHFDRIFGIFERLHGAEHYEGTGIGLALVKKAVARLGGTIRVESEVGRGSTFVVTLPVELAGEEVTAGDGADSPPRGEPSPDR